jgi:hypothetical protein
MLAGSGFRCEGFGIDRRSRSERRRTSRQAHDRRQSLPRSSDF